MIDLKKPTYAVYSKKADAFVGLDMGQPRAQWGPRDSSISPTLTGAIAKRDDYMKRLDRAIEKGRELVRRGSERSYLTHPQQNKRELGELSVVKITMQEVAG